MSQMRAQMKIVLCQRYLTKVPISIRNLYTNEEHCLGKMSLSNGGSDGQIYASLFLPLSAY